MGPFKFKIQDSSLSYGWVWTKKTQSSFCIPTFKMNLIYVIYRFEILAQNILYMFKFYHNEVFVLRG